MNPDISNVLDLVRPRDRQRVDNLLQALLWPDPGTDPTRVTVNSVGGGGDESQIARWEPADQVGLPDWLAPVLESQAAGAAPSTAKVRIRGWLDGGRAGPSATAVLEPAPRPPPTTALPAPAATPETPPAAQGAATLASATPSPAVNTEAELMASIATLDRRLFAIEDSLRWHREALRVANATILALEQELRRAHATLAPALADRAALERELARAERRLERLEASGPEQDRRERKLRRQRDQARAERDAIAEERDEAESTAEQARWLLREKFGYHDDDE